jgi:peptidyl-prolyl cis-trans isomerase B (cyclophilin B)
VATKKERQRQLARERYQRRMVRQAARAQQTRKLTVAGLSAVGVVGVVLVSLLFAGTFSSSPKKKNDAATKPSASASATPTPTPTPTQSSAVETATHCTYIKGGTASRKVHLPPVKPDAKAKYQATVVTNRGDIVINMLNKQAPCTVGSFVSLADQKFFNNSRCFRLTTAKAAIYVLQCGDPTGTGKGGPGYGFGNENLPTDVNSSGYATYAPGTVAMANVSGEANSNGSQFFLVYKDSPLPPDYTTFGTIVSGLNIIQNVAKAGTNNSGAGDGAPKEKVQIMSVTIKKI